MLGLGGCGIAEAHRRPPPCEYAVGSGQIDKGDLFELDGELGCQAFDQVLVIPDRPHAQRHVHPATAGLLGVLVDELHVRRLAPSNWTKVTGNHRL
ncbi:hypothetical protein E9998_15095 [Glycomyces paridis]|uniref:Uncharacterized protein n=1 Tax=Glycomyces paridis TaxID=2126555 RepID=A0A4S8PBN1_9ACTN|nr:hypothetical protein E9998_15095 [Glycomyces paridis]